MIPCCEILRTKYGRDFRGEPCGNSEVGIVVYVFYLMRAAPVLTKLATRHR